jgi:hypothetical protein
MFTSRLLGRVGHGAAVLVEGEKRPTRHCARLHTLGRQLPIPRRLLLLDSVCNNPEPSYDARTEGTQEAAMG